MTTLTRHRSNKISAIKLEDNSLTTEEALIEDSFVRFFNHECRNQEAGSTNWPLEGLKNKIDNSLHDRLEADVTNDEIWEAIRSMGSNLTPGIDGITVSFYKFFWNIVGMEVREAVKEFFCSRHMSQGWKETLVVLIPKCAEANSPSKFRPISLCRTVYKVIAKILVSIIKYVLPSIIS